MCSSPALEERKSGVNGGREMTEGEKHFIGGKHEGQIGNRILRVQIQDDRVSTSKRWEDKHLEEECFSSEEQPL